MAPESQHEGGLRGGGGGLRTPCPLSDPSWGGLGRVNVAQRCACARSTVGHRGIWHVASGITSGTRLWQLHGHGGDGVPHRQRPVARVSQWLLGCIIDLHQGNTYTWAAPSDQCGTHHEATDSSMSEMVWAHPQPEWSFVRLQDTTS